MKRSDTVFSLPKFLYSPYTYIFLMSYYGVWLVWNYIKIPFTNPAHVSSYLPSIHYNPENNVIRFALAILVPPVACIIFWLLKDYGLASKYFSNKYCRRCLKTILIILCVGVALGTGIIQGTTTSASNPAGVYGGPYSHALVDTFHEGETLGPAISYEQPNLKPYKNFVIIHGVFQDPLRSVIAFKLFGTSIGAERAFTTILFMLTGLLYYILVLVLFRGDLIKSALGVGVMAMLILPTSTDLPVLHNLFTSIQLPFRDIPTMLFLMFAILTFRYKEAERHKLLALFSGLIGFVLMAGYANSLDRAIYITILSVAWLIMLLFMTKLQTFWKTVFIPFIVGCILGVPVLGLALKWDYIDMIRYILTMGKYKGYLDGEVFAQPTLYFTTAIVAIAVLLFIGVFWLLTSVKAQSKIKTPKDWFKGLLQSAAIGVRQYHTYILLFLTSGLFMDSAIDRVDLGHFEYSVQWLYLLLLYMLVVFLFTHFKKSKLALNFIILIFFCSIFAYVTAYVKHINISQDALPIHVSDKELVRPDYLQAANYLKSHLKGKESFVTLTSEGIWYYLVNKPSPIQYPIIYYAYTQSERKSLAQSIASNPNIKYIVTNNNWTSDFDFVPNPVRFPEVYKVLYKDYRPKTGFGQQTIWERT